MIDDINLTKKETENLIKSLNSPDVESIKKRDHFLNDLNINVSETIDGKFEVNIPDLDFDEILKKKTKR